MATNETEVMDDGDVEIEIIDDRPEVDQREPADLDNLDESEFELSDEEIKALSSKAQKRIKQLVWKTNEERRQREQALREREEAIEHARRVQSMSEQEISKYQKALLERQTTILSSQVQAAQSAVAAAHEEGDPAKIAEAQAKLTQALIGQGHNEELSRRYAQRFSQGQGQENGQSPPQPQQQRIPTPQVSEATQKWMQRNPWFNRNTPMTAYAVGVHQDLLQNEGIQPDTPQYFSALDKAIRERFPEAFDGAQRQSTQEDAVTVDTESERGVSGQLPRQQRSSTPVAPTRGRGNGSSASSGKIQLTRTEVETAKRLGVPLVEYARQKRVLQESM